MMLKINKFAKQDYTQHSFPYPPICREREIERTVEEEEDSSRTCVECEVLWELLLHMSVLIPPPVLGFERFEGNKLTSIYRRRMIFQFKEEDEENNGYGQTD